MKPIAKANYLCNTWRHSKFQKKIYIGLFGLTIIWICVVLLSLHRDYATSPRAEEARALAELARHLRVNFSVTGNARRNHTARISLANPLVDRPLGSGIRWRLYFSLMRPVAEEVAQSGGFRLSHVNGYLHRLDPLAGGEVAADGLAPGRRYDVEYVGNLNVVSRYDSFPNWYAVLLHPDDGTELLAEVLAATAGESLDFVDAMTRPEQYKLGPDDPSEPWTPLKRAQIQDGYLDGERPSESLVRLVPRPVVSEPLPDGQVPVPTTCLLARLAIARAPAGGGCTDAKVVAAADLLREAAAQAKSEAADAGAPCETGGGRPAWSVELCALASETSDGGHFANLSRGLTTDQVSEAYELRIDPQAGRVTLTAAAPAGLFWGAQSLVSVLQPGSGKLSVSRLFDYPRAPYRGLMLDVARNFLPVETVLRLLDAMSAWKLNRLHLHLSDDEGLRVPVTAAFPTASSRCHPTKEAGTIECAQLPQLGSHPTRPLSPPGSGHYSVADYAAILRRAESRFVRVVPEMDTPAHSLAAIQAYKTQGLDLLDPDDPFRPPTPQAYRNNTINPCLPAAQQYVVDLLAGTRRLHEAAGHRLLDYHFGGDEAANGSWVESPACRRMLGLSPEEPVNPDAVVRANLRRLMAAAHAAGVSALFGWADGFADADGRPFNLSDLAVGVRGPLRVVAMPWHKLPKPRDLAAAGYSLVMAPADRLYLDHRQEPDPEERGLYWATPFTDLHDVFAYDAAAAAAGATAVSGSSAAVVIGMSGALWGETTRYPDQAHGLLAPRLLALAERAWHRADWEDGGAARSPRSRSLARDWAEFVSSVGHRELSRLARLGVRFRVGPPGARRLPGDSGGGIRLTHELPGVRLFYSATCGGAPPSWIESDRLDRWPAGVSRICLMAAFSQPGRKSDAFFAQSRIVYVDR